MLYVSLDGLRMPNGDFSHTVTSERCFMDTPPSEAVRAMLPTAPAAGQTTESLASKPGTITLDYLPIDNDTSEQ